MKEVHYFQKTIEGEVTFFTVLADANTKVIVRSAIRTPGVDNGKQLPEVITNYMAQGYDHQLIASV